MMLKIEQQLIDNISQLLKRSIIADSALAQLKEDKQGNFSAIFPKGSVFKCTAMTFQPYIEEVADELMQWQQNKDQQLLVALVKKIEQLFKVIAEFETLYQK
ncbi:hypothetical protein RI844_16790 [Thalassotalea fonticola]|uniref:Prephenate dehydrogenase n=1 Tax=Thalassotalea fonticola TaxID=3065649 RepID=A0ABZ0GMF5_9GAMM|nr:hypothetical protein RI844_16790 [Colwelliaceae bacterium S1-1]